MKNCARCPKPGGCRNEPCRFAAYQEPVPAPSETKQLRWSLLMEHRSGPVDRSEPGHVTRAVWERIREAYGHLCDRANAWDDEPVRQLPLEDTASLYETAPETPSSSPLPAERHSSDLPAARYVASYLSDPSAPGGTLSISRLRGDMFELVVSVRINPVVDPGLSREIALAALDWHVASLWKAAGPREQVADVEPRRRAVLDGTLVTRLPENWRDYIVHPGRPVTTSPIVHPAGVIPPETEAQVTEQIQTSRLSDAVAGLMRESGVMRRAINRMFG